MASKRACRKGQKYTSASGNTLIHREKMSLLNNNNTSLPLNGGRYLIAKQMKTRFGA